MTPRLKSLLKTSAQITQEIERLVLMRLRVRIEIKRLKKTDTSASSNFPGRTMQEKL